MHLEQFRKYALYGKIKLKEKLREAFRMDLKLDLPRWIAIENTSDCNLHCKMCVRHHLKRGVGYMKFRTFMCLIDEISTFKTQPTVNLQFFGEPLKHPGYINMIRYAKKKGIATLALNTNGTLLDSKMAVAMINAGIDIISISIDAFRKETYNKIRHANFYTVINNVNNIIEYCKRLNLKKPKIQLTFVYQKENKNELYHFVNAWIDKVDAIYSQKEYNNFELVDKSGLQCRPRIPCRYLWKSMVIYWNGDVTVCPMDDDGKNIVGNIHKSTLKEIWFGEEFNKFRSLHLKNRYNLISACAHCDYWRGDCGDYIQIKTIKNNVIIRENELHMHFKKIHGFKNNAAKILSWAGKDKKYKK